MNCFFILLLYFFARVRCDTVSQNGSDTLSAVKKHLIVVGQKTDILVSVRQFPSLLHKCTATFIGPDALLTTAKCLYCEDCLLFVHGFSSTLTDESQNSKGVSYTIKKTVIHPDYERDPQKNNVGLIQLTTKVSNATVFALQATVPDIAGLAVESYRWQFTPNFREYNLEKVTEKTISNAACSALFNKYIDYKHVCTHRNEFVLLGQFDQGVPIIDRTTGVGTIIGIYETEGKTRQSRVGIYQAIFPFVAWINKILASNFVHTSPGTTKNTSIAINIPISTPLGTPKTPAPFTEIPPSDNSTSPAITTTPTLLEPNKGQQTDLEKEAPDAMMDSSQRKGKPW